MGCKKIAPRVRISGGRFGPDREHAAGAVGRRIVGR